MFLIYMLHSHSRFCFRSRSHTPHRGPIFIVFYLIFRFCFDYFHSDSSTTNARSHHDYHYFSCCFVGAHLYIKNVCMRLSCLSKTTFESLSLAFQTVNSVQSESNLLGRESLSGSGQCFFSTVIKCKLALCISFLYFFEKQRKQTQKLYAC